MNVYSILNWNRDYKKTLESLLFAKMTNDNKIILCTNQEVKSDEMIVIKADTNIAKSKNMIIKKARELGAEYLFMLEDDVLIKDPLVFDYYLDKMEKYGLGMINYGFNKASNRVLKTIPNPSMIVKINENGEEEYFSRFPSSTLLILDLKKVEELFNENLLLYENEEFFQRCSQKGHHPFNGFYFDLPKSWQYFESTNEETMRVKNTALLNEDNKRMKEAKINIQYELDATKLLKFLQEKNNG